MRYLFSLLFLISLSAAFAAQPLHQNLLYAADITTGGKRLFGGITLDGKFETQVHESGHIWKVKAGSSMVLRFNLPTAIKSCVFKIRQLGISDSSQNSFFSINRKYYQPLEVAKKDEIEIRLHDLGSDLHKGENSLQIIALSNDLGIQNITIYCAAPLPTVTSNKTETPARVTLVSPIAGQAIRADKPLEIAWTTENLPSYAHFNIDYLNKDKKWKNIDQCVPYNYPDGIGRQGTYQWKKLPADIHPQQLQVRLSPKVPSSKKELPKEKEWTDKKTGMTFVFIPPGCFKMGSPTNEKGHQRDEKQTCLCINGFYLGKTEVTNAQYNIMMGEQGLKHDSGYDSLKENDFDGNDQPVVRVGRTEAHNYARWLSNQTGETFRLPTEAEWEYAARADTQTAYYWGDNPNQACDYANIADKTRHKKLKGVDRQSCSDTFGITAPVASFKKNHFGLFDMIGNVAEWTCSGYHEQYDEKANTCQIDSLFGVVRGGSWKQSYQNIRSAKRIWFFRDMQEMGFRLVRELP